MPSIAWPALFASSVIAAIFGGLIAGFVTLRVARNQYVNDYYKTVVQRRLAAYEQLEYLITMLKTSVADDTDNKVYHLLFSGGDGSKAYETMLRLSSQSMWLSDEVAQEAVTLNRLLFSCPIDQAGVIAFAKEHYRTIADTRTRLERLHARDFLTLHKVPQFLKGKKPSDSYGQLPHKG